MRKRS
jgi:hypothetical protein